MTNRLPALVREVWEPVTSSGLKRKVHAVQGHGLNMQQAIDDLSGRCWVIKNMHGECVQNHTLKGLAGMQQKH